VDEAGPDQVRLRPVAADRLAHRASGRTAHLLRPLGSGRTSPFARTGTCTDRATCLPGVLDHGPPASSGSSGQSLRYLADLARRNPQRAPICLLHVGLSLYIHIHLVALQYASGRSPDVKYLWALNPFVWRHFGRGAFCSGATQFCCHPRLEMPGDQAGLVSAWSRLHRKVRQTRHVNTCDPCSAAASGAGGIATP
jgi:hypothetical protein